MAEMFTLARISDFMTEVTIIINEDQPERTTKFTVPQSLLTEGSEYFKAACRNNWKEATSRVIKLPDVDVDVFKAYMYWVHRKEVCTVSKIDEFPPPRAMIKDLINLWILGDRLANTRLRNTTIDWILEVISSRSSDATGIDDLIPPDLITRL